MKISTSTIALSLAAYAAAFPGMAPHREDVLENIKGTETVKRAAEAGVDPASITGVLGGLTGIINGLLGSVAESVNPDNLRPEPGYVFKAPGKGDSRGPCPGLNLLANYGYLPRNGHVTYGQVLEATARGFNMGADLAAVLATFAVLTDGDITTESWYLGTNPKTLFGGLNRHSSLEADISPNREDYWSGCGDNHHLSSRLFTQNVQIVAASGTKQFDLVNMGTQYATSATFSKTYNPYIWYFPFPLIVSTAAFAFYPRFFSNGTYQAGGVANYESISSIIGAKYIKSKGQFAYVPERWPKNWYRSAVEYDAVTALTEGLAVIYARNIVTPAIGQFPTANFNITTLFCDIYQGIQSITPLLLVGGETEAEKAITWALAKLDPYFNFTTLGCPQTAYSPVFPTNSTDPGSALNPPPSVVSWVGNNVYNKIYFETAPFTPQCNHSYKV